MKKKKRTKKDVTDFIKKLTRKELEEIARVHIEQNEKSKKGANKNVYEISLSKASFILNCHRSTLYKKSKPRIYKFDI